ncbi:hypothetical protein [Bartonella gabonensis]|uniref:hypothetical protein n=1 Tax=Bartonella gabonensis TaxID=2699889 RepID=UPI00158D9B05|nr:hypothetical protein [Bartonella gabonensis]
MTTISKNTLVISKIANETTFVNKQEPAKKYEFTGETIEVGFKTLYRIRALRDFGDVKKGDLGGFIQGESNLSHDSNCWVGGKAKVYSNARVYDNAVVSGYAHVNNVACIYENARVYGKAVVAGQIYGNAKISGYACIFPNVKIFRNAVIKGDTWIHGNIEIRNKETVYNDQSLNDTA